MYSPMFCWHAYNLLSTSLVVFSNQTLLLAGQQLTPSSLCDSCQSYIVNLTDHWTLHSWMKLSAFCFQLRRPHCPLESTSQQRHTWHHTPSDHCPSWEHRCTYRGRTETVVENFLHLWCQTGLHLSTHPILCCHWLDNSAHVVWPRYHRGLLNIHWSSLCERHCLASSVGHECYHITQELQWFCFTSRTQHLLAEDKTTEHRY